MEEFISNISAEKIGNTAAVSWSWPVGYDCVRIVFLHKAGTSDVASLSPGELDSVSDLCFMDEFRIAGGKYIYPAGSEDKGLLRFRVYCCDAPGQTDFTRASGIAKATVIPLGIKYRVVSGKSGKNYRKIRFELETDAEVPAGTLSYRIAPSGAEYPINVRLSKGHCSIGGIVAAAHDSITLGLAEGHEDEFIITVSG